MGKSKRNTPKPNSQRQQRLAERHAGQQAAASTVTRPFAGLASECDLVALREFVPSATASLSREENREIVLSTVLPGAVAGLVRADGATAFIATQVQANYPDPAAALAAAAEWATDAAPGDSLPAAQMSATAATAAEVLNVPLTITVHNDFSWWIPEGVQPDPQTATAVEQANQAIMPSARLSLSGAAGAAWWVDAGEKAHIRWVRPEAEDALMLALARLHAAGTLTLGEGSRFAGSFRTHGLLVPVFDLDRERHADEWSTAALEFDKMLAEALAVDAPLSGAELRSRDGLRARQITLR